MRSRILLRKWKVIVLCVFKQLLQVFKLLGGKKIPKLRFLSTLKNFTGHPQYLYQHFSTLENLFPLLGSILNICWRLINHCLNSIYQSYDILSIKRYSAAIIRSLCPIPIWLKFSDLKNLWNGNKTKLVFYFSTPLEMHTFNYKLKILNHFYSFESGYKALKMKSRYYNWQFYFKNINFWIIYLQNVWITPYKIFFQTRMP